MPSPAARCVLLTLATSLAACASRPAPAPAAPTAPARLGPSITRADLDARLADGRLRDVTGSLGRREDGPQALPTGSTPPVTVDGAVISVLACRPGGSMPVFVADAAGQVYTYQASSRVTVPAASDGAPSPPMPSTYCSYQRFELGAGQVWAGALGVTP